VIARTARGLGAALFAVGLTNSVDAADVTLKLPVKAPASVPSYDWNGLYFGGHVGYSRGSAQVGLGEPDPTSFRKSFGSLTGGIQAGYNRVLPSRLLLGVEADLSVLNALSADELAWFRTTADTDIAEKIELMGTLRGRVGYTFEHWMIYATGGFAWSLGRFIQTPGVVDETDRVLHLHTGWSAGAGTEVALAPNWTLRLEYLYLNFGNADVVFPSGATAGSSYDIHTARAGLNYKIGGPSGNAWAGDFSGDASRTHFDNWEIHGQTTYIQQGYPAFHSPYLGENSFTPWAQTRQTWTASAFLGLRLWEDGAPITIRSCCRASACMIPVAPPAFPTAKPRNRIFRIRATTRRACSCGRRLDLAASRKPSQARTASWARNPTYRGSPSRSESSPSMISSTTMPMPWTRAPIS
jgi:high affinity Mn2+ porin